MTFLQNHHILSSRNLDEMRSLLAAMVSPHDFNIIGNHSEFEASIHAAPLGGISLLHAFFGNVRVDVRAEGGDENSLLFYVPTSGAGVVRQDGQECEFSETKGFVRDLRLSIDCRQADFGGFALPLSLETLKRHASALIGEGAEMIEPAFHPSLDFASPSGRHFCNTLKFIARELDGPLGQLKDHFLAKQYEDLLLTQVLTLLPNTYSDLMHGALPSRIVPYHVKRAREYIHAHAHERIGLADIAAYAGCGYRTLQVAFHDALGMSPMAYAKSMRLRGAREDLKKMGGGTLIAPVACKWGFTHMGHFARDYKRQFGMFPSETARFGR